MYFLPGVQRILPTGGGYRHINGLIRTEKDPHCLIPVDPRDTGCVNFIGADLLFSLVILLTVMNRTLPLT